MEQAVNQFSKGLQLDTNPMVQGNDSLSDALNATFITMNGNEVILQNDMGNRRVDNAYLPSGYEPIGMKEYGGVIYVAAYNPITNRSQIGSFPSPERRIGEEVEDLGTTFSLTVNGGDGIYRFTSITEKRIKYLKEDSLLIPLTKDTSLHTGDKFSVYCSSLWNTDTKKLLTNFDNVNDTGKLLSPKNRKFTLSLGILNSQNEFVDITSSLERWDDINNKNKIIEFENSVSDLYKFNKGYFIAKNKPEDADFEAIDDREFIKNRLSMAVNTYSYKLIGPLYLKVNYNHISSISYSINGSKNDAGTAADLELTVHVEYNCPDGYENSGNGDDIYEHYGTNDTPNFDPFYFCTGEDIYLIKSSSNKSISKITYNQSTNLYSVDIISYYKDVRPTTEDSIIKYLIGVPATISDSSLFIKGLSKEGQIDISLLGSGKILLKEWRFVYDEDKKEGIISYGLEAYPKVGHTLDELQILFIKCKDDTSFDPNNTTSEQIKGSYENYNWIKVSNNLNYGTFTVNSDTVSLEDNTMYNVYIRYQDCIGNECNFMYYDKVQWFITSDIFNDKFNSTFNFNDITDYTIKSHIDYIFNPEIKILPYTEVTGKLYSIESTSGYLISNPIKFETEFTKDMSVVKGKAPSNITIESSEDEEKMYIKFPSITATTIDIKKEKGAEGIDEYDDGYNRELNIQNQEKEIIKDVKQQYSGKIDQFMYAEKLSDQQEFTIEHEFINFGNYLGEIDYGQSKGNWFKPPWIGIESYKDLAAFLGIGAQSSFVVKKSNNQSLEANSDYQRYTQYGFYKSGNSTNDKVELKLQYNQDILNNAFNSLSNSDQTFIVADSADWFLDQKGANDESGGQRRKCCLVWMRYRQENDVEDKWMLVCQIVLTRDNDQRDLPSERINWNTFVEYLKNMKYYSNFGDNQGSIGIYIYNKDKKLIIEELQWNINLNIKYSAKLELNDSLSYKRVNFNLEEEIINKTDVYPITIKSSDQPNNKSFLNYISKMIDEVENKTLDCYCKDAPKAINLQKGHLYKVNNEEAIEVGAPNPSGELPYFPFVTDKYPSLHIEQEEYEDYKNNMLDLKGIPVIEGFWKYSNFNKT